MTKAGPQKERANDRIMTGIRTKQGQIKRQALKKTELMAEYIMGRDKDRTFIPQRDRVNDRTVTGIGTKQGQGQRQALKKTWRMTE